MDKTIIAFAEKYRLRVRRDECGDPIVIGKTGHIYEYGEGLLGVLILPMNGQGRIWANARGRLEDAGCQIWQDGDTEGTALFDPQDHAQAKLAIRLVGAKPKRRAQLSPAFIAARERFKFRRATVEEGHGTAQKPAIPPGTTREKDQEETTLVYAGEGHEGTAGGGSR